MSKMPPADKIALEMYAAAERSRDTEPRRHYLGMSSIGDPCERKLWYGFRGFSGIPISGRSIMIFRFGDHVEEDVVGWLKAAGYRVEGQQDAFNDHDRHFSGHCDGIIHGVSSQPHILEIKSANDKKFSSFKGFGVKKTYQVYYDQAQCYMGYSGLDRALFVIQNKNTSEIYTEKVYFDAERFHELRAKAYRIITSNDPPAQAFDEDSFQCKWCDYRILCWNPKEALVANRNCGCCYYFGWKGLKRICRHPEHNVEILDHTRCCPDWCQYDSKETIKVQRV